MSQSQDGTFVCFFYGTLMNVDILCRVIGTSHDHLEFADAVLKEHTRHHVKGVDYPAVVPASQGRSIMARELSDDEASVRGTVVRGLTKSDIGFLDTFEGDEYYRAKALVHPLSPFREASTSENLAGKSACEPITANVYLWTADLRMLDSKLWSYADFLRDKAHLWVGSQSNPDEYVEVDRRRQMDGKIVHHSSSDQLPRFGHHVREKEFDLEPGLIHLNHGGVGASPKSVTAARQKWLTLAEQNPDKFFRRTCFHELAKVKRRAAEYLKCDATNIALYADSYAKIACFLTNTWDLVSVLNATTGVNIVLRSLRWQKGDCILYFPGAVYGACLNTLFYLRDHYNELGIRLIPIEFVLPQSTEAILSTTRKVIEETLSTLGPNERLHLGLMDAIVSRPGVLMPWIELCALFKEYNILSLVDAAHLMGQMPINLEEADPDFWVSNAHKWCFVPRSLAVFYVPARNHHLIETFPTSFGYVSSATPKTPQSKSAFEADFSYTGTQDVSSALSLPDALDFRIQCGGEERIYEYCHKLATDGAELIAKILDTEVMQNEENTLIASMANIRLEPPTKIAENELDRVADKITWILLDDYSCSTIVFAYNNKLWVRICAQIYNELSDYEYLGTSLLDVIRKPELWKL